LKARCARSWQALGPRLRGDDDGLR